MDINFVNLTAENLADEHLSCIIRSKKPHPGVEAKRLWLSDRLKEGHVFRKLNVKAPVFIEYAPLETAWVPINGDNYYYIYCLWVSGGYNGKGYGKMLMDYCLMPEKRGNPVFVCSDQRNRNPGFPTSPLRRNSVLRLLMPLITAMSCSPFLLTEQSRNLPPM